MKVFIGLPTYDGRASIHTFDAVMSATANRERYGGQQMLKQSLLAKGFNLLWCTALKQKQENGVTHFAMLHADVIPSPRWVDRMYSIMCEHKADVVSAIVPLKTDFGVTSTAVEGENPYKPKRFTMKQIMEMPETFTHEKLLINTGCMLVDLTKPWVDRFSGFHIDDEIIDGEPMCKPEDWNFSRDVRRKGGKLVATRAVHTVHVGNYHYPNHVGWGTWERDEQNGEATLARPAIKVASANGK